MALYYSYPLHKRFFKKKFNCAKTHCCLKSSLQGPGFKSWPFLSGLTFAAPCFAYKIQSKLSFCSENIARIYDFVFSFFPELQQLTRKESLRTCHLVPAPFLTTHSLSVYQINLFNFLSSLSEMILSVGLFFKVIFFSSSKCKHYDVDRSVCIFAFHRSHRTNRAWHVVCAQ